MENRTLPRQESTAEGPRIAKRFDSLKGDGGESAKDGTIGTDLESR
jgi:hypothetical protein